MIIIVISKRAKVVSDYSFLVASVANGVATVVIYVLNLILVGVSAYRAGIPVTLFIVLKHGIVVRYLYGFTAGVAGRITGVIVCVITLDKAGRKSERQHDRHEAADKDSVE